MEGPDGGLRPDPARAERVERDLGLLRLAVPALQTAVDAPTWVPNNLVIQLPAPGQIGEQVQCLNDYFQVTGINPIFPGSAWMLAEFPHALNPGPLAEVYLSTGEVLAAHPNGIAWICDPDQFVPAELAGGLWQWYVSFWPNPCHFPGSLYVSAETDVAGNVTLLSMSPSLWIAIAATNPPNNNPFVPGLQPFQDVLDTGTSSTLTAGIGGAGTLPQGDVQYDHITVTFGAGLSPALSAGNVSVQCLGAAPADSMGCCAVHDSPGCDDSECEATVCTAHPFCCDHQWSTFCAQEAVALCGLAAPECAITCPSVTSISGGGAGPYEITLSGPIPPGCTTLTFLGGTQLQYQSLPGDVDFDGTSTTQDLLALIQALNNGQANLSANLARYNINRSTGASPVNTQDLLRLIQLLNGTNTTQAFNGATVAECP